MQVCNTLEEAIKKAKHEELAPTSKIGLHIVASVNSDGSDKGKNSGQQRNRGNGNRQKASSPPPINQNTNRPNQNYTTRQNTAYQPRPNQLRPAPKL